MEEQQSNLEINRQSWNNMVDIHFHSTMYDIEGFLTGESSLKEIELALLGDIADKSILHLQCHFGQDSISLARMGAKVVGVDFSDKAIELARDLANKLDVAAEFICCDIYDLPHHLDRKFDLVFTSYGTICWLPDLDKWAKLISRYLQPNGKFLFVEFHPVVWMFDDHFTHIKYSYFNKGAVMQELEGNYADKNADLKQNYVEWSHSLSEIFQALISNGFKIDLFNEYDYSPHNCFQDTIEYSPGKFRIEKLADKIPLTFAIEATKT